MSETNNIDSIRIREVVRADLDSVVILEHEIYSDPWSRTAFEDALEAENWDSWIAETESGIIGYACTMTAAGECHLANIAITQHHRRKSVAKRLMDHILDIAIRNECEKMLLEVRPSNLGAIAFYEKFEFERLYVRPNYYHDPKEDALVMIKDLTAIEK